MDNPITFQLIKTLRFSKWLLLIKDEGEAFSSSAGKIKGNKEKPKWRFQPRRKNGKRKKEKFKEKKKVPYLKMRKTKRESKR